MTTPALPVAMAQLAQRERHPSWIRLPERAGNFHHSTVPTRSRRSEATAPAVPRAAATLAQPNLIAQPVFDVGAIPT